MNEFDIVHRCQLNCKGPTLKSDPNTVELHAHYLFFFFFLKEKLSLTVVITVAQCRPVQLFKIASVELDTLLDESLSLVYTTVMLHNHYHLKTFSNMNTLHVYVKKKSQEVFVVLTNDICDFL